MSSNRTSSYLSLLPAIAGHKDFLLERPMPNATETERVILGSIILDNGLVWQVMESGVTPEMFYVPSHRVVFEAMISLTERGSPIDQVLIANELQGIERLGMAGGLSTITQLMHGIPYFANLNPHIKVLKGKFWRRRLIQACNLITSQTLDEDDDDEVIFTQAEEAVMHITSQALRHNTRSRGIDYVHVLEDKRDFVETLTKRAEGISDAIPTGLKPLDDKLEGGGLNPQGFYLVAAQAKAGKTSLVLSWAENIARSFAKQGIKKSVVVASLEMRRLALQMRLFSAYTKIPFDTLMRPGKLKGLEREAAFGKIDEFFNFPLYINDAVFSLPELWRANERAVYGPAQAGLVIVDYLQLLSLHRGKSADPDSLTGEVTIISRELKHMAQELNVPLVGISSLNRLGELRQSGSIDYDVEALIRLENPDFNPKMTLEERALLDMKSVWDINARLVYQRNGPTGDIMLKFLRKQMKFMSAEEYELTQQQQRGLSGAQTLATLWDETNSGSLDDPQPRGDENTYEF